MIAKLSPHHVCLLKRLCGIPLDQRIDTEFNRAKSLKWMRENIEHTEIRRIPGNLQMCTVRTHDQEIVSCVIYTLP